MRELSQDVLLGKTLYDRGYHGLGKFQHVLVHAPTDAGKSTGFTLPNCFTWPGSLVVLDVKRQAFEATAGHRAYTLGQDVYLFDPSAEDGRSHRWDPLATVQRATSLQFKQISRVANLLFPEIENARDKFWDDAGRQAFQAVASLMAETPGESLIMSRISRLMVKWDWHEWITDRLKAQTYSALTTDAVQSYLNKDSPKLRDEIRQTVSTRLQMWLDPQVTQAVSSSSFDLRDIRKRPMTIYVAVAPGELHRMRPLLRLFFGQLIALNTISTSWDVPVLLMIDEFIRMGRLDVLAHAPQYVRGYGMRMAIVVQNKAQVRQVYDKDGAADIFDNMGAEIVMGTADQDMASELEKRLGDSTRTIATANRPRFFSFLRPGKQTEAEHPHRRPLMLDQEVSRMPPDQQLILRPGMRPIKARKIRWYADRNFTDLVLPPPEIPLLTTNADELAVTNL